MKFILHTLFLGVFLGFVLNGCVKQPETIVINENPETTDSVSTSQDTIDAESATADFRHLIIGEIHPIPTLDPLFADNNSIKRTIQLLYEGLVRYDQNGEVIPAISKEWTISDDSLAYTFMLRGNVFYHDSEVFDNGLGRKVVAQDFKNAFERMAYLQVPDEAARMFMSISGFEPFFNEQHYVFNPVYRELNGINGIQVPNDSTIIFNLIAKDPHFLHKLASPYAVVYPHEAIADSPRNFAPVGSGPFELSQQSGNSTYIFAKNTEYWQANNSIPELDRIDVIVETDESELFKALASDRIHLIPESGPQIIQNSLTNELTLQAAYANRFTLTVPGGMNYYSINYYKKSNVPEQAVKAAFSSLNPAQLTADMPAGIMTVANLSKTAQASINSFSERIYSTYSEDPYHGWMLTRVSGQLKNGIEIRILKVRTPTRNTALYSRSFVPQYPGHQPAGNPATLISFSIKQAALSIDEIQQLKFNKYPWWMDMRNVSLPGTDQL